MTEAQAGEAILQFWKAAWEPLHPDVQIAYDDEVFETVDEWVRVTIVESDRRNAAIGGARLANTGTISVEIFSRPGLGALRTRELADDARACLENKSIPSPTVGDEPIDVYEGSSRPRPSDGGWAQRLVLFSFRWDAT